MILSFSTSLSLNVSRSILRFSFSNSAGLFARVGLDFFTVLLSDEDSLIGAVDVLVVTALIVVVVEDELAFDADSVTAEEGASGSEA